MIPLAVWLNMANVPPEYPKHYDVARSAPEQEPNQHPSSHYNPQSPPHYQPAYNTPQTNAPSPNYYTQPAYLPITDIQPDLPPLNILQQRALKAAKVMKVVAFLSLLYILAYIFLEYYYWPFAP